MRHFNNHRFQVFVIVRILIPTFGCFILIEVKQDKKGLREMLFNIPLAERIKVVKRNINEVF